MRPLSNPPPNCPPDLSLKFVPAFTLGLGSALPLPAISSELVTASAFFLGIVKALTLGIATALSLGISPALS
jgi:hypothetical protein